MSGKDAWFREYERLYNERDAGEIDATDDELADEAFTKVRERLEDHIDQELDRRKDESQT